VTRRGAGQAEFAPLDTGDTAAIARQRGACDCAPRGDCFPDRTESRQIGRDSRQPLSNRCHAHDGACTMRESLPMRARARRRNVSGSRALDVASAGYAAGSRPIDREAARPSRGAGPTAAASRARAGSDAAVTRRSSGTDLNNDIPTMAIRSTYLILPAVAMLFSGCAMLSSSQESKLTCHIPRAVYPDTAKPLTRPATVLVRALMTASGEAQNVTVTTSSRNAAADRAAVEAMARATCTQTGAAANPFLLTQPFVFEPQRGQ